MEELRDKIIKSLAEIWLREHGQVLESIEVVPKDPDQKDKPA